LHIRFGDRERNRRGDVAGVGASFEWFCLNARLATLVDMVEDDSEALCDPRL